MNKLLIHSQKTVLLDKTYFPTEEQYVFQIDSEVSDVDEYINSQLSDGVLSSKISQLDVVFIKVALSDNYLEYLGIRLAYHIRLTKSLNEKALIPIIFIGDESYQFLGLTYELPEILFTGGIYLMSDTIKDYEKFIRLINTGKIKPLKSLDEFINRIRIFPPANYQSNHSVANEWCILRWSEMAKNINESLRLSIKDNIKATQSLYFKYLEALSLLNSQKDSRQEFKKDKERENLCLPFPDKDKVKIYYIDDEADKGWGLLFKEVIFKEYSKEESFDFFNDFKKGESKAILIERLSAKIETLINKDDFNVFIVDLRLCDEDFLATEDLSGFSIISKIKQINKGVQIVVFTASKKAKNVNKILDLGSVGYVIKESPENILTRDQSFNLYVQFINKLKKAIAKSFLSKLRQDIDSLKNDNIFISYQDDDKVEFRNLVFSNGGMLDELFSILDLDHSKYLNSALLICYTILESYADLFGTFESTWTIYTKSGNPTLNYSPDSAQTLFEVRYGLYPDLMTTSKANETLVGIDFYNSLRQRSIDSRKKAKKATSILRIATVLKYRDNISAIEIDRLFRLRYIRNNAVAHAGNIKPGAQIKVDDINFIINDIFKIIFN